MGNFNKELGMDINGIELEKGDGPVRKNTSGERMVGHGNVGIVRTNDGDGSRDLVD